MFSYMMYNSIRHHFFHMANKFDHQMRSALSSHLAPLEFFYIDLITKVQLESFCEMECQKEEYSLSN